MTYYFDMDGTIADLYGVSGWLDDLISEKTRPYEEARPLVNCEKLAAVIVELKAQGISSGIISWTSKNGSKIYNKMVRKAKLAWLAENFPNCFEEIHIVKYGTPKSKVAKDCGILFDDEEKNRKNWKKGESFSEKEMLKVLGL